MPNISWFGWWVWAWAGRHADTEDMFTRPTPLPPRACVLIVPLVRMVICTYFGCPAGEQLDQRALAHVGRPHQRHGGHGMIKGGQLAQLAGNVLQRVYVPARRCRMLLSAWCIHHPPNPLHVRRP